MINKRSDLKVEPKMICVKLWNKMRIKVSNVNLAEGKKSLSILKEKKCVTN